MRKQLILLAALLLTMLPAGAAFAQSDARCFTETGYCISGPIRSYWERNGGLAVFGYPLGPQQNEQVENWTGPVQWFERDRLEDHSNQGIGVLAGRLGAEVLEQQGRAWQYGNEQPGRAGGPCRYFNETGYNVCNTEFRRYWERNGGLERFGYPITPLIQETIEGRSYQVQYFERRRMEFHPENAAPYNVLLGLLGRDVFTAGQPGRPCPYAVLGELQANYAEFNRNAALGCPTAGDDYSYTLGSAARFERGVMYWVNQRGGRSLVIALFYQPDGRVTFRSFVDTWRDGDMINSGLTPPAGLFEPNRGFGKIWREYPEVRQALGWALENERTISPSYQGFAQGVLLRVPEDNLVWHLGLRETARSSTVKY
jgi:hypothetical protein